MAKDVDNPDDDEDDDMPYFSFGGVKVSAQTLYLKFLSGTEADPHANSAANRVGQEPDLRNILAHRNMAHLARDTVDIVAKDLTPRGIKLVEVAARQIISDFLFQGKHRDDNTEVAHACVWLAAIALWREMEPSWNEPRRHPPEPTWRTVEAAADLMEWTAITGLRNRVKTINANARRSARRRERVALLAEAIRAGKISKDAPAKIVSAFYRSHGIKVGTESARKDLEAAIESLG